MIKRVWAYTAATILLTQAIFSQPSLLRVPSDYRNLDDALHYALAQGGLFTIHLETEGPHTLTHSSYRSLKRSYISLEGPALPYVGRYYGHQVCTFQPGDAVTGQGPYSLTVEGSTITVDPARLEVLGKGTYEGIAPDFSQIVPGIDKLVMCTHTGETTEHDIIEAEANTITIQEPIVFSEGDGFTIKPRASIVLAPDHETVTFSIKGSLSFRGIALELNEAQVPRAIFEEVTRLVGCLSWWHCRASEIETSHVVHVGKKAGLEITHTYEGDAQTFLGAGLTVYANNYAQGLHSCFIGCEKAIDAGTYGHAIEKEAEFYNCATGIWADGGSQVAVPGSWLRKCDRGLRLSANSSCMNSASLTMSQVELGIRAMFNSQFHATSLFLDTVSTHAHIDEQSLTRLTAPITPGVQTLCPEGYGAYHSGVSYTYLTSTPDETPEENVFRAQKESVEGTEAPGLAVRANKTFLDAIPSEPFVSYNRKKFQMPKQVRPRKKEQQATTRGFRISEKAPCEPCCQKDASSTDLSDSEIDPTDNKLTEAINISEEDAQTTEVINMPEEGVQKAEAIKTSEEDAQKKERESLSPKKASSLVRGERRRGANPSIYINHSLEGVRDERPISVRIKNKAIEVTHRTMKRLASLDDLSEGSLIIGIAKDVLIEIPYDSLIEEWRELNQLLDKDLCITIKWRDDVPGDEVTYEFSNIKVRVSTPPPKALA